MRVRGVYKMGELVRKVVVREHGAPEWAWLKPETHRVWRAVAEYLDEKSVLVHMNVENDPDLLLAAGQCGVRGVGLHATREAMERQVAFPRSMRRHVLLPDAELSQKVLAGATHLCYYPSDSPAAGPSKQQAEQAQIGVAVKLEGVSNAMLYEVKETARSQKWDGGRLLVGGDEDALERVQMALSHGLSV